MILILAALFSVASQGSNEPPQSVGQCKWVQGRFAIYNGSSLRRIWLIGTRRIIALKDTDENLPPEIERYQHEATEHRGRDDALFGRFFVCARERSRSGRMQHVRLIRTKNLLYRGKPFRA